MLPDTQTAEGRRIEGGVGLVAEAGRVVPGLDTRVARFDAAADCATYSATAATWATNVAAARVSFINFATLARVARLRYHSSDGQTTAPYVLCVVNAPDDAAANRALAAVFFNGTVELTGGQVSQLSALNVFVLSKDNAEHLVEGDGIERIDAVAVYGGTAAGSAALEVAAW